MVKRKKGSKIVLNTKDKKAKRNLEQGSEISLWLDSYDDLFSVFDPRPYSHRALSNDFLSETKKVSVDKDDKIDLELLMPKNKRSSHQEEIIKKRLKEHFNRHHGLLIKEKRKMMGWGISLCILGILLMFTATSILFLYKNETLLVSFLIILLEPAGWFIFWKGGEIAFFESRQLNPDLDYNRKMSKCKINFVSY